MMSFLYLIHDSIILFPMYKLYKHLLVYRKIKYILYRDKNFVFIISCRGWRFVLLFISGVFIMSCLERNNRNINITIRYEVLLISFGDVSVSVDGEDAAGSSDCCCRMPKHLLWRDILLLLLNLELYKQISVEMYIMILIRLKPVVFWLEVIWLIHWDLSGAK